MKSNLRIAGNQRTVMCAVRQLKRTPVILWPHASVPQPPTVLILCLLIATSLPTSEGWTAWLAHLPQDSSRSAVKSDGATLSHESDEAFFGALLIAQICMLWYFLMLAFNL
jgi:hypothetical protein